MAPVPESVSRSTRTSSEWRANRLNPASRSARRRCSTVVIRRGSTEWIRNGSMMVRKPTGSDRERQVLDAVEEVGPQPLHWAGEAQPVEVGPELLERGGRLEAGEVGTEAEMGPTAAERCVGVGRAPDV